MAAPAATPAKGPHGGAADLLLQSSDREPSPSFHLLASEHRLTIELRSSDVVGSSPRCLRRRMLGPHLK